MEAHNLQAASTYINNLLLARGLLRNGKTIDFARPENGGGIDATMAKIINLINDLVLRRDREAEHRENLARTIQSLRATESQQAAEIERLKSKNSELARSLALAEGQERAFKTNLQNAEATIRGLKDQVQRMKTTIQQVRAQCANDIRKRDAEMQKLKSHLADRQRGKREGLGVTTININPTPERNSRSRLASVGPDVNNPGYSLKQESTEFLTELCQSLSDENDTLISLARNTIQTLKELQGLSNTPDGCGNSNLGASGSAQKGGQGPVTTLPTSCEELTADMNTVLDHLRTLLTNPSFVPLEEVEVREEEIMRLREGWERMESRWKEAMAMMDGWHKRISEGLDSADVEELRRGMGLDLGRVRSAAADVNGPSIYEDEDGAQDCEEGEEEEDDTPETSTKSLKPTLAKRPIRALGERNGNIGSKSPRKVSFHEEVMDPACDDIDGEKEELVLKAHTSETVTQRPARRRMSKIPRQANRGPRLSIEEKLAAVEAEAQAAAEESSKQDTRKRSRSGYDRGLGRKSQGRRRSTLTHEELEQLMGVAE
ncbi:hypothetical protein VTN77DRAFT_6820 [Rasamsonia byssochlamydoides]|uniref:uncharacterized protein n=1 Tax=Rasamsonia byssochlamydoides TaxID=89139 RepID=UPI0037430AA5